MTGSFDVIAHRGGHVTHPENTMAAFEDALQCGADGIEFDVRLTRDLVPVVIHDDTLERTTDGHGTVSGHSVAELAGIDAGSPFAPEFRGERIPLLADLLDWATTNDLQLHLEIKSGPITDNRLVHAVTEMLQSTSLVDRILVSSFDHDSLIEARRRIPELRVGLLYWYGLHEPWRYARCLGAASLNCLWDAITRDKVESARAEGIEVRGFNAWDEHAVQSIAPTGCAGLITPDPELVLSVRSALVRKNSDA